jgi:2-succinyl-6-hydroxy-2,4-cyclohexadiene-1-carboxylate synthase
VVYRPFQLDPMAPPGVATPVAEVYAKKFGGPERAAQIFDHLTQLGAADGLDLRFDLAVRANTMFAHQLLWMAEQDPGVDQGAVKEQLLAAYFTQGRHLGDPDVVAACGAASGMDGDALLGRLESGEGRAQVTEISSPELPARGSPPCPPTCSTASGRCRARRTWRRSSGCSNVSRPGPPITTSGWDVADPAPPPAGARLASSSQGEGPRLVLVHGFTQTRRSWAPLLPDFAVDHTVVTVDAPGHGDSADIHADLWQAADLLGEVGGEATYLGYSMGGRIALHLALSRPDLVQRLVLVGVHAGLDDEVAREARCDADEELARSIERDGVAPFLDRWLAQSLFDDLTEEAAGREDRLCNTAAGLASSLRLAGTGRQESLWSQLGRLTVPVLVLAGERDVKFRAVGLRLAEAIGPHASFASVDGTGHSCHLEAPATFARVVRRWLAAHPVTGSPATG